MVRVLEEVAGGMGSGLLAGLHRKHMCTDQPLAVSRN